MSPVWSHPSSSIVAGLDFVVEVSGHHLWATHPQLPLAADVLVVTAVGIHQAALGVGNGDTRRARSEVADGGAMADRAEFCHAVALDDLASHTFRGAGGQLGAERRRSGEHLLER